ncbi:MAG: DUF5666 domain-containing protein [Gemmataceae bacterium]
MNSRPVAFASLILVVLSALAARPALGHDKSLHKGKPVEGVVLSVSGDSFEMKTDQGTSTVHLSDKTFIERGESRADKAAIAPGEHVSVFGNKTEGGMFAKEVVIGTGHPHADHPGHQGH